MVRAVSPQRDPERGTRACVTGAEGSRAGAVDFLFLSSRLKIRDSRMWWLPRQRVKHGERRG
ncbi:hypothetical protein chiPu_0015025, partial [Chiloscyllium punctatum]|nr:hypothetical protein [Chiloscyllium punctatum]